MRLLLPITVVLALFLLLVQPTFASYFYLSPDSGSFDKDSTFSLQVKLNTEDAVLNGVSSYLAFPQDKLEAVSVEINKSVLPIVAEESIDGNVIKFSGGNFSSLSGSDLNVGTINFKAKALGNAIINFIPGSAAPNTLDSEDSLNLSSSKGANIQIKDAVGTTSNPNPSPGERKIIRCQDKEAANKSVLISINHSFADLRSRFDTIFVLVDDYYTNQLVPNGKNSNNYLSQRTQVEVKRTNALEKINTFNNDSSAFSCSSKSAKEALTKIRTESQAAKSALKDYQSSLKSLIGILRIVN